MGFTIGKKDGFEGGVNDMEDGDVIPWERNPGRYKVDGMYNSDIAVIHEFHRQNPDIEIDLIRAKDISKKRLQSNDINYILGHDLVDGFWGKRGYEKTLEVYKSANVFPVMKLQKFVVDKGDYYEHFRKNGIPVADTFTIKRKGRGFYVGKRKVDAKYILEQAEKRGWKSMISKVVMGAWGKGFKKWKTIDLKKSGGLVRLDRFLASDRILRFPGVIFQEEVVDFWEVRTYWFDNKYVNAVATQHDFSIGDDYILDNRRIKKFLPELQKLGKKVLRVLPRVEVGGEEIRPVMMRIDFGCCLGGRFFVNEIENMACNLFVDWNRKSIPVFGKVLGERSRQLYRLGWRRSIKKRQ